MKEKYGHKNIIEGALRIGAAYIRVSTEEQIEFSPDSQFKKIKEYAGKYNILLPQEFVYLDEGISGRSAQNRPKFMEMISQAKTKPRPFEVILVWKFSRFARSRQDSILYKSMLRKECGVDVISITEQLSDDPTAILIEALLEAMDEYYSVNLAQEVKRGMSEKFSRGGVVSVPPFGYRMGNKKFEIDENTADFVNMIYKDFLNGMSYRQIAVKLNAMGIHTQRGNLFENRTVEYILSNPTYLGKIRRKPEGADRSDRFYRGENVLVIDAGHDSILSEEVFAAVQKRIKDIKKMYPQNARTSPADFMLRGLVRCSSCGSTLTQAAGGKALQCYKYSRGQCGESHYVDMCRLNMTVIAKIEEDFEGIALQFQTPAIIVEGNKERTDDRIEEVLILREYKRLERIKAAYEMGIDGLEEYRKNKEDITGHIRKLEQSVRNMDIIPDKIAKTLQIEWKELLVLLKCGQIKEAEKNVILRSFISKIIFKRSNDSIQIYYYI